MAIGALVAAFRIGALATGRLAGAFDSEFPSAEDIYHSFMEELRTECVAPAKRERQTPDTPPTSLSLGGVTPTTPDAPRRKRPAARAPNVLAKLLLNSAEDVYQSVMEEFRAKYVAPAIVETKRERHMRVLMSLRTVLMMAYMRRKRC
ncbi:uncharacterized protein LOC114736326 [Neltuma alba]|uniref:uncharacterized protein LOC114736326 n=1 Tax=Neltuma alba TaxID=207710 RepID=UPI0010A53C90|nr:uncharacterized protein LOC114736326 [Prosopis alba]